MSVRGPMSTCVDQSQRGDTQAWVGNEETHCNPMIEKVRRIMRMGSEEPRIVGVPLHSALRPIV